MRRIRLDNDLEESHVLEEREGGDEPLSFWIVFKRISTLAIPMSLSITFSFEVFFSILLLHFLSQNNDDEAAATLISVWMNTICLLAMSPLFGVAIQLSGKLAEMQEITSHPENHPEIDISEKNEIVASMNANALLIASVATPPAFLALFFSKPLLVSVFRQNEAVAEVVQNFLRTYSYAVPGLMARAGLEQIMYSFGKTNHAMWLGFASLAISGGFAYTGSFGWNYDWTGTAPPTKANEGSLGIAIGLVIGTYANALAYGLYVWSKSEFREYNFFKNIFSRIKNNTNELKNILKIGGPISFIVAIELAMTLYVGILSGFIGTTEQAAMKFIMQYVYFEFIALIAFSFTCTQEISRELDVGRLVNANRIGKYGLLTTLAYLTPLPLIFALAPIILEILSGGAASDISSILKPLVPIMSAGIFGNIIRYNLLQQLYGIKDFLVPTVISVIGISSGIILSCFLGLDTSLRVNGIAIGYTSGAAIAAAGLLGRWYNQIKVSKLEEQITTRNEVSSRAAITSPSAFFRNTQLGEGDNARRGNTKALNAPVVKEDTRLLSFSHAGQNKP